MGVLVLLESVRGHHSTKQHKGKEMMADSQAIKCVVVGDGAVGKSCMLLTYTTSAFPTDYVPTVVDSCSFNVLYNNRKMVNLSLWDTPGQEEYARLLPLYYPSTDVFLLCYSSVDKSSLANIKTKWYPEVRRHCPNAPTVLVATKTDLRDDPNRLGDMWQRSSGAGLGTDCVSTEEGRKMAEDIGADGFVECSALTPHNLSQVFNEAIRMVVDPPTKRKAQGKAKICSLF